MKRFLGGAVLLSAGIFTISAYANPDDSCDGEQTIFDAYTVKGGKHVGGVMSTVTSAMFLARIQENLKFYSISLLTKLISVWQETATRV